MLSSSILEKTTHSFRKGYNDGYFGEPFQYTQPEGSFKPFGQHDYAEGYTAGKTDKETNDRRRARRLAMRIVEQGYKDLGIELKNK